MRSPVCALVNYLTEWARVRSPSLLADHLDFCAVGGCEESGIAARGPKVLLKGMGYTELEVCTSSLLI